MSFPRHVSRNVASRFDGSEDVRPFAIALIEKRAAQIDRISGASPGLAFAAVELCEWRSTICFERDFRPSRAEIRRRKPRRTTVLKVRACSYQFTSDIAQVRFVRGARVLRISIYISKVATEYRKRGCHYVRFGAGELASCEAPFCAKGELESNSSFVQPHVTARPR